MATTAQAPTTRPLDTTLDGTERDEIARLATVLAGTGSRLVDDLAWLDQARALSSGLPAGVRAAIRRFRHDPGSGGLMTLRNLPVGDTELPPTPTVAGSVERAATVPAAVAVLLSLHLGEIASFREEKTGALVQNVVPVPGQETEQSNAGSIPLDLHVENAFHRNRPDYVGLLCLRGDHTGAAGTLTSSIREALPLLSDEDLEQLRSPAFVTEPPPSFGAGDSTPVHAVLEGDPADPNVRVDFHATHARDDAGKLALERLRDVFLDVATELVLQPGEMAFVDNRVAIHGRTAFTPRYDGRDRWLHRTFVHLDHRRTRVHRADGGPVLS
ncbi:TauD/TfdA family dioxygenase [Streptomyces sp. NPDC047525]|uniref:TauD/TfdA family dioxygenase n=1 Tax=Streptomyces sp. NPDC047525 TaxID=3155264 RepID=UPI0033D9ED5A